uniref:Trimethylguanosine synthase n=1 Tax=Hyaloperonospora arabidopsidis (strain Emoy2) TaxID=559515 RepID=M4BGE9_HYAAE
MTLVVTEIRLQSPGVHKALQGKKNIRRSVKQESALCTSKEESDACTGLYEAAQAQLEQEMKEAGVEGSLPMSFGSGSRRETSRKRKRLLDTKETENVADMKRIDDEMGGAEKGFGSGGGDDGNMEESRGQVVAVVAATAVGLANEDEVDRLVSKETLTSEMAFTGAVSATAGFGAGEDEVDRPVSKETLTSEMAVVNKVRVVFDSDGEVAGRVIEQVEVVTEEKAKEEPSVSDVAQKTKRIAKKKKKKHPVAKDVLKFYMRRHTLFEKFENGIQLDHESWFSVTPQAIAEHIAMRLSCDVVLDPFAGCGGNVIQLAMTCKQVIAIDIDPVKIRMAKHNAAIYGVADKIEWIVGDSIDLLPSLQADVVFLSPPWGGVDYNRTCFSLDDMLVKGVSGLDLFAKVRKVSKNVAYYLPRGTPTTVLKVLAPGEPVECENIFLDQHLTVMTAYYGDLAAREVPEVPVEEDVFPNEETVDA